MLIDIFFVILIVWEKMIRMQNKHVSMSEQTPQKYIYNHKTKWFQT